MKWSLFNWKKPVVSSGEPEDYQVVKNTVSQNERNITNLNNRVIQVDNRIDTATANMVSTNTTQTITGEKTLSNTLTLTKTNGALAFKPGTNQPGFIEFYNSTTRIGYIGKGSSQNNNIVIGAQFGDIVLETATNNGVVIPEPRNNNNPATKNYVDTKETTINNQITAINNRIVENNTILKRVYTFTPLSSTPSLNGDTYRYIVRITDLPNVSVLGISPYFSSRGYGVYLGQNWEFSYAIGNGYSGAIIYIYASINKTIYDQSPSEYNINFSEFNITIFYMENSSRETTQIYQGEIVNLEVNNEN